jgi:hypothetical protein
MIHNKPRNYLLHLSEKGNKLYKNQRVKEKKKKEKKKKEKRRRRRRRKLTRPCSLGYLQNKISAHSSEHHILKREFYILDS